MADQKKSEGPKEPTPAEAMAIAQQALEAAEQAKSAAEARPAIEAAAKDEAEAQGNEIDPEQTSAIADALIAQMEARGAFNEPPPPAEGAPESASAENGGGAPTEGTEGEPASPAAPPIEDAPRKPSLAERFQRKTGE